MTSADLIATVKKQPIGVACGVLCIVIGALIYLRTDKITGNQALYEAKSAEATKILANVRNSDKLPEQVTEVQAMTKEMESRLVRAGQLAVNLQYFYKLEAENEVKLTDVRQNNPAKSNKTLYTGVPYSVAVQGSYKQVMVFLQRLENGRHFCHFNSATFNKVGGSGDLTNTAMTLNLSIELLGQP